MYNTIQELKHEVSSHFSRKRATGDWFHPSLKEYPKQDVDFAGLNEVRLVRLQWLAAVWETSGDDLLVTTGAERVILWIRWLLKRDFTHCCFPVGDASLLKAPKGASGISNIKPSDFNDKPIRDALASLHANWLKLWVRMAFHRMDYDTAIAVATQLNHSQQVASPPLRACIRLQPPSDLNLLRHQAELLILEAKGCSQVFSSMPASSDADRFRAIMDTTREITQKADSIKGDYPQLYLEAKAWSLQLTLDSLECLSAESTSLCTGDLKTVCDRAIDDLHSFRSLAKVDEPLLNVQHMWLMICRARLAIHATSKCESLDWNAAYSDLEAARSFAKSGRPHHQAIVELYAAQILIAHAEWFLLAPERDSTLTAECDAAMNKLTGCRAALARARESLRIGRRNTRWWRLYYNLQVTRTIWLVIHAIRSGPPVQDAKTETPQRLLVAELKTFQTIRHGLSSIRHRINLEPRPVLSLSQLVSVCRVPASLLRTLFEVGFIRVLQCCPKTKERTAGPSDADLLERDFEAHAHRFRHSLAEFGLPDDTEGAAPEGNGAKTVDPPIPSWTRVSQKIQPSLADGDFVNLPLRELLGPHVCLVPEHR